MKGKDQRKRSTGLGNHTPTMRKPYRMLLIFLLKKITPFTVSTPECLYNNMKTITMPLPLIKNIMWERRKMKETSSGTIKLWVH